VACAKQLLLQGLERVVLTFYAARFPRCIPEMDASWALEVRVRAMVAPTAVCPLQFETTAAAVYVPENAHAEQLGGTAGIRAEAHRGPQLRAAK
jgi:hypothetical protein